MKTTISMKEKNFAKIHHRLKSDESLNSFSLIIDADYKLVSWETPDGFHRMGVYHHMEEGDEFDTFYIKFSWTIFSGQTTNCREWLRFQS